MCFVAGGLVQGSCSLGDCAMAESCEFPIDQDSKGCCSDPGERSKPIDCVCCELEGSHENDLLAALLSPKLQLEGSSLVIAVLDGGLDYDSTFAKTVPKPRPALDWAKPVLRERLARLQSLRI